MSEVYDSRACRLGEGPLWHPLRRQLFWFDILEARMLTQTDEGPHEWTFPELVSAAGWLSEDVLLIASETQLFTFDLDTGVREHIAPLEADNSVTRSNDGRADPMGGFWIGTMGKKEEKGAGAIYRYYKGELRQLYGEITVSNSICFAPGGRLAYWSDTVTQKIMRTPLDAEGWPSGEAEVFVDLAAEGLYPDGSVVDSEGALWNAQWGAGRVVRYLPDGSADKMIEVGGEKSTCPAFGGEGLTTLYVTTACGGMEKDGKQGVTYMAPAGVAGLPEPQVIL
ncbi:SMP-30/gluconolactonase/LRE family protein [Vannielia litorea]|uniref:SMP-30/gluconolactonase/LRE family protein n=1 Tax=Vannielia litorea TaxID=1217970 RepID=UPI001C940F4B|nr:SMP-30/gluconolactonase/LRE family protein [Vannielia litorea]MBY6048931.1 SMP-30/gluconolactonase/LRE family protein [Vannielia litorea]MBY6076345.1 SMP-30/gluconolactonase/LRE family protein [Vannielia litorea]